MFMLPHDLSICANEQQGEIVLLMYIRTLIIRYISIMKKMVPIRPVFEEMMPIHVINSLLNPASFPRLCFNLNKSIRRNDENEEILFFFSGVFHSQAYMFDPEL